MPVQLLLTPTARQDGDVYIVIRDGVPANIEAHGDGLSVLNGTVDPTGSDGVNGEFWINTTAPMKIFGPKVAGVWPAGVSLVGADGADGAPGVPGTPGTPGADGTFTGDSDDITEGAVNLFYTSARASLKANLASPTFTGTVGGITASMVGLGNVTNTSDANKPVSTAQQTALDLKADLASPTFTGTPSMPTGTTASTQSAGDNSTKLATTAYADTMAAQKVGKPWEMLIAVSDETTALTTGTAKVTFRMPAKITLTDVRASVTTAPTGGTLLTVDVNESGTTILSTKLTFDASEKTTTTAATPRVISDSSLADDAEITIDIDAVGSTIAGAGLKVLLIGTYAA
jgi:hypothetical protein